MFLRAVRMIVATALKKYNDIKVSVVYLSCALMGALLMLIVSDKVATACTSLALIGCGVGASFPVILNQIGGKFQSMQGTAFSIAIIIALMGQFVFNFFTGKIFDEGNQTYFPLILVGILVIMILMVVSLICGQKRESKTLN